MSFAPIEAAICKLVREYYTAQHGRAPKDVSCRLIGNWAIVRLEGTYSTTEAELAASEHGRKIVQSTRREHRSLSRKQIEGMISQALRCRVLRSFYDLDAPDDVHMEVYELDRTF